MESQWTSLCLIGRSSKWVIFHSYVKFAEGKSFFSISTWTDNHRWPLLLGSRCFNDSTTQIGRNSISHQYNWKKPFKHTVERHVWVAIAVAPEVEKVQLRDFGGRVLLRIYGSLHFCGEAGLCPAGANAAGDCGSQNWTGSQRYMMVWFASPCATKLNHLQISALMNIYIICQVNY